MASSRWKRFAFFEKHALSISSEVLNDILAASSSSGRHAEDVGTQSEDAKIWDAVSLVVSTASLPLKSKPREILHQPTTAIADPRQEPLRRDESDAVLSQMWTTLNACTTPELASAVAGGDNSAATSATVLGPSTVSLPSQSQSLNDGGAGTSLSSEEFLDGLVLVFTGSHSSSFVHCFDVTVRCNPPEVTENSSNNTSLEDLDGWRGYLAPFAQIQPDNTKRPGSARGSGSDTGRRNMDDVPPGGGIIALATSRAKDGHGPLHLACISKQQLCIWEDPHLYLSCRLPLTSPTATEATRYYQDSWNSSKDGHPSAVDVAPGGIVAVGSDNGAVLVFIYGASLATRNPGNRKIKLYLRIPPPPAPGMGVVSVKISHGQLDERKVSVFVAYRRSQESQNASAAGICCYDMPTPGPNSTTLSAPSARHDLDGRHVPASGLCDAVPTVEGFHFTVARQDGLYTYNSNQKVEVSPIDGSKHAISVLPPQVPGTRSPNQTNVGSTYLLVAARDSKSDRDVVDIYDSTNKLVAFHLLLSPGHLAVKSAGITTATARAADGRLVGGRSSAIVVTSGGSLISFTEKATEEKVSLLVQKNLFSAAVSVAYADPSLDPSSITSLYRKYAEHLYRKGDYAASIEQYINTIGALEPSHVTFRFLAAPTIQYLVKYLEELRARDLATPVHCELLRTCYLKLNDTEAAESISAATTSASLDKDSLQSLLATLSSNPKDAFATICSLEAPQAAEVLVAHGAALARIMPRETAGIVVSLCLGTYSPARLADAASEAVTEANKMLAQAVDDRQKTFEPYPVRLFYSAFLDNPKMLRLILAHCNRNKCHLTPSLRRTLLELTLEEWQQAKRAGDTEVEKLRYREAIAALTDTHSKDINDYDALVLVQQAGFDDGELLLFERLQMGPMLLSRYAHDGSEKSRRQMLAMCQADPELLADVLGHFVSIASDRLYGRSEGADDDSEDGTDEILDDIHEALAIARLQGSIAPVRIARILAGEGTEQFSSSSIGATKTSGQQTVPISVALEFVGSILAASRSSCDRLKSEIQEYNELCNAMEAEVASLLKASLNPNSSSEAPSPSSRMDIDGVYSRVRTSMDNVDSRKNVRTEQSREAFWREMNQSEDSFDTIARFFAKGVIQ